MEDVGWNVGFLVVCCQLLILFNVHYSPITLERASNNQHKSVRIERGNHLPLMNVYKMLYIVVLLVANLNSFSQDPVFVDGSDIAGIQGNSSNYSAAITDIDLDGWKDIYIGSKNEPNLMYRNNGDGTFTNIAGDIGVADDGNTHSSLWSDFDNDGDIDGFVVNYSGPNAFYINSSGHFVDMAPTLGLDTEGQTRCVITADINLDGFLDIYVVNLNEHNEFWLSDGQGGFVDYYWESGATDDLIGMGAVFFDSDNDGDQDLYLTHDANQPNYMFINDGTGHFTEHAEELGLDNAGQGMGVDVIDFNHDGWLDIYITNNFDGNTLYLNHGDGSFLEISQESGTDDDGMGWGVAWTDFNLDGRSDLYVCNNYVFSPYNNVLYENEGDSTFSITGFDSVLESPFVAAGMAVGDLDNNGTEDFVICNSFNADNPGVQLLLNYTTGNNWVGIDLDGTASNPEGIGSVVKVFADTLVQTDVVLGGSGYSQMNSTELIFGLGELEQVDSVQVQWTNGLVETFSTPLINQVNHLMEGSLSFETAEGDFNNDGIINIFDLLVLLTEVGCSGICSSDINNDGVVNVQDLLFFLLVFGQ